MSNNRGEMPEAPAAQVAAEVPAPEPKREIDVVALRDGFFGGQRMKEGQEFKLASIEQLGLWMKCLDPKIEARRAKPKAEAIGKVVPKAGR